ncbi:hypothetical protein ABZP36_016511 [Zizania latifolia]
MGATALLLVAVAAHLALVPAQVAAADGAFSEEPPATRCAAAIVSIAPCLAHVALVAPPAPAPTEACCAAFLRGVSSSGGGEGCFCHLVRNPLLLGFPVNTVRLGALLPTCSAANASAAATVEATVLFADMCRADLKSLPEMRFRPDPPPTPTISPAAVPGSMPPRTEVLSTSVPRDRSGSETSSSCWNFLVALLVLTATAAEDLIPL